MNVNEEKLSCYIDSLNNEKKPKEHGNTSGKKKSKYTSRNFLLSLGSVAAVLAICITATVMPSTGKNKIFYVMAKSSEEVKAISTAKVDLGAGTPSTNTPKVKVPFDLEVEKNSQKSIDAGHSPWRLDPVFVSQVFVSLKLSPQGIVGDYPIKTEDLKLSQNNGIEAMVEVSGSKTPIRKVYLKRVVRQDSTGIWTVIGYDPK